MYPVNISVLGDTVAILLSGRDGYCSSTVYPVQRYRSGTNQYRFAHRSGTISVQQTGTVFRYNRYKYSTDWYRICIIVQYTIQTRQKNGTVQYNMVLYCIVFVSSSITTRQKNGTRQYRICIMANNTSKMVLSSTHSRNTVQDSILFVSQLNFRQSMVIPVQICYKTVSHLYRSLTVLLSRINLLIYLLIISLNLVHLIMILYNGM